MSESLTLYNAALPAEVTERRGKYELALPSGRTSILQRDVDFGKPNAKLKQPILYKGGAEKIKHDYNVFDRYEIMNSVEDFENGYFFYRFKCRLVIFDPQTKTEFTVCEGYGSANTRESNTGNATGFDVANTKLKIARKRAMVDAVINMAGLSGIFTQDIENDDFMAGAVSMAKTKDTDPITSKQRQRIFAIGAGRGMSVEQVKAWLTAKGFASVKDIKQSDYDNVCKMIEEESSVAN
jgi:hypothetical protein